MRLKLIFRNGLWWATDTRTHRSIFRRGFRSLAVAHTAARVFLALNKSGKAR